MDAIRYLKTRERLCQNNECRLCPLGASNNGESVLCVELEKIRPEKMVEMVKQWAKEHPGVTRMDEFINEHPNTEVGKYKKEKFVDICPQKIDNKFKCRIEGCHTIYNTDCYVCKVEYWNEEVEK